MNETQLKKQLAGMGITKAVCCVGTSEGLTAVFLRWDGREEIFTGMDELNPLDPSAARVESFKDSNL